MHYQYQSLCRGPHSLVHTLQDQVPGQQSWTSALQ